jgi:hypothetical protein
MSDRSVIHKCRRRGEVMERPRGKAGMVGDLAMEFYPQRG